jgi:hypothetical protein
LIIDAAAGPGYRMLKPIEAERLMVRAANLALEGHWCRLRLTWVTARREGNNAQQGGDDGD